MSKMNRYLVLVLMIITISCSKAFTLDKIWEIELDIRPDSLQYNSGNLYVLQGNEMFDKNTEGGYKTLINARIIIINPENGQKKEEIKISDDNKYLLNMSLDVNGSIKNNELYFLTSDYAFISFSFQDGKYKILMPGEEVKDYKKDKNGQILEFVPPFNKDEFLMFQYLENYRFYFNGNTLYYVDLDYQLFKVNINNNIINKTILEKYLYEKPFMPKDGDTCQGLKYFNGYLYFGDCDMFFYNLDNKKRIKIAYEDIQNNNDILENCHDLYYYSYINYDNNENGIYTINPLFKNTYDENECIVGMRITRINKKLEKENIIRYFDKEIYINPKMNKNIWWRREVDNVKPPIQLEYRRYDIYRIAVDEEGYIYITDQYNKTLAKYKI